MPHARFFLICALLGLILPWIPYVLFVQSEGVNLPLFLRQIFANLPATGFTLDIVISTVVFWIWSFFDARENGVTHWWLAALCGLALGLSVAMPLYFMFRLGAKATVQPAPAPTG